MSTLRPSVSYQEPQLLDSQQPGPVVLRITLGARLRELRVAAGISRVGAARAIWGSAAKIGRLEQGKIGFKLRDVSDLLRHYGVTDEAARDTLLALARQANERPWWHPYGDLVPGWFQPYLGLEQAASVIRSYEVQFVPGLLQIPDYARAVFRLGHHDEPEEAIERRVELRMKRQQILHRSEPTRLWAVIDEAALRRTMGGVATMRAQVEHLMELSELRHVTIQLMPLHVGGHAAAGGTIAYLRLHQGGLPDVVYLEQLTSAVYPDKHSDIVEYRHVLNQISVQALEPEQTKRALRQILQDLDRTVSPR